MCTADQSPGPTGGSEQAWRQESLNAPETSVPPGHGGWWNLAEKPIRESAPTVRISQSWFRAWTPEPEGLGWNPAATRPHVGFSGRHLPTAQEVTRVMRRRVGGRQGHWSGGGPATSEGSWTGQSEVCKREATAARASTDPTRLWSPGAPRSPP